MPAENEFEKSVQHLLEGLQVAPAPSDWQAVYNQLHPEKKRRIIWWWMPVLLALVVAGVWMRNEPGANSRSTELPIVNAVEKKSSTDGSLQKAASNNEDVKKANANTSNEAEKETTSTISKTNNEQIAPAAAQDFVIDSSANLSGSHQRNEVTVSAMASDTATTASAEEADDSWASNASLTNLLQQQAAINASKPIPPVANFENTDDKTAPALSSQAATLQLKRPNGWQWLLYAGAGINITGSSLNTMKAAQDMSTGSPTNVMLNTVSQQSNGWHASAGLLAQLTMGRRWHMQAGASLNYGTWHGKSQTFRDSFATSNMVVYRSLMMTQSKTFHAIMLELPVVMHYKLAGKKNTTWWMAAGINNQFVLSVKEKTNRQQVVTTGGFSSTDAKSITSTATTWQPQLRAGFTFDHRGNKTHWQLSPLANFTLSPFFKSPADGMGLHNLQLQFLYYLNNRK